MRMSHEVHTVTVDTRHCSIEVTVDVERHERLALQLRTGDDDTARDQLLLKLAPVDLSRLTDERSHGINILRCHDHEKLVVEMQTCLTIDDGVMVSIIMTDDT